MNIRKTAKRLLHYIEGVLEEGASFDEKDIARILSEPTEGYRVSIEPKKYDYDKMINCAAMLDVQTGLIWTGKRHGDVIKTIIQAYSLTDKSEYKIKSVTLERFKQGFVTMSGRFVDRKEAAMIAVHAGQAELTLPCELFSEDLY